MYEEQLCNAMLQPVQTIPQNQLSVKDSPRDSPRGFPKGSLVTIEHTKEVEPCYMLRSAQQGANKHNII